MSLVLSGRRSLTVLSVALLAAACESTPGALTAPTDRPSLSVVGTAGAPGVVISQVYGGGGNSGATYRNDYIELYNAGPDTANLSGWSVQYASAGGTSWAGTNLSGKLAPGRYYLVQEAAGAGGTTALPTPDAAGGIAMGATAGKVALVSSTTLLAGTSTATTLTGTSCPASATVVDFVGFGSTATCYEGSGPTATIANATATLRKDGGRQDTNINAADFATAAPAPRNTGSPELPPLNSLTVTVAPSAPASGVGATVSFTASATKGGQPVAITSAAWTSSNAAVATIDAATGSASAVATGTTTIGVAVTTAEGTATGSTVLTVTMPVASVTVAPSPSTVAVAATRQFAATAQDASNGNVTTTYTWASSNTGIATISASGLATGVAEGTTTITATSPNGVVGQATLTVTPSLAPGAVATVSIGGRNSDDPRLSPTFYDQFFATARNAAGATVTTTFTWGTTTPDLITVDQRGNVGAKAPGNALITATSADGRVGTFNLVIVPAVPSTTASYVGNAEFGEPTDADASDDYLIRRAQYTASYNRARGGPNWVSYNLEVTAFGASDRCDCFSPEPALPADFPVILTTDYTSGGYDRGHMVRSADRTAADYDNATTFYFSNVIPQHADNNQGPWSVLEDSLAKIAKRTDREVYIITGGADSLGTLKGEGKVVIPARTWKIAVVMQRNQGVANVDEVGDVLDVIATDFPNVSGIRGVSWTSYKTTVASLEALTGYDFLAALPDDIERCLEGRNCAPTALITGAGLGGGNEGDALTFSASTSSDRNGDALSYEWTVAGAPAGTNATLNHVFSTDGTFAVQLIVADAAGAKDTATTSVTVLNVAPTVAAFAGATILPGETYTAAGSFTDPGLDPWTATVSYEGAFEPLALEGRTFELRHLYAAPGTYTVTVRVNDGDATATRSATVLVQTPQQSIATLTASLSSGLGETLGAGQLTSLRAKLNAASIQMRQGNPATAANILGAFVNELGGLVNGSQITTAAASPLIAYAQRLIASLR